MESEKDSHKKETLFNALKENDETKIQDFLLRNGKKKSYSPIFIHAENDPVEVVNLDDIKI